MPAKSVDQLIEELIAREGGYVNDSRDAGGETNFGITKATAVANGYTGPMRAMPRSTAALIYRQIYWLRPCFDDVAAESPEIAEELFDTGVNMGPADAVTFLQRALNALNRNDKDYPDLTPDGRAGPQTIFSLRRFIATRGGGKHPVDILLKALNCLQGERYIRLAEQRPENEAFLYGWLANRVGL